MFIDLLLLFDTWFCFEVVLDIYFAVVAAEVGIQKLLLVYLFVLDFETGNTQYLMAIAYIPSICIRFDPV